MLARQLVHPHSGVLDLKRDEVPTPWEPQPGGFLPRDLLVSGSQHERTPLRHGVAGVGRDVQHELLQLLGVGLDPIEVV